MERNDAEDRFKEASHRFKMAWEKAGSVLNLDAQELQMIIIDLDAAIPGLEGENLGLALVTKANCLINLSIAKIRELSKKSPYCDLNELEALSPYEEEAILYVERGQKILKECGGSESAIAYAKEVFRQVKGTLNGRSE